MPISDGVTRLKKIMFQVGDRYFRFAINPENYVHAKPHRTAVIKTKSRIVIEDFQEDVPTITISGTTGFNPTGLASDRGINKIKEMKKFLEDYARQGGSGNQGTDEFFFYNFTNDESYVVHLSPEGVNYTQDANSPLLYQYSIKFVVLREASTPADEDILNPEIGNKNPSVPNKGGGGGNDTSNIWDSDLTKDEIDKIFGNGLNNYNGNNTSNIWDSDLTGKEIGNLFSSRSNVSNAVSQEESTSKGINPQAPSTLSYLQGTSGLGYSIGYYGRSYRV